MSLDPGADALTGVLLVIDRLQHRGRPLDRGSVLSMAAVKLPGAAASYHGWIAALLARGWISGAAEAFALTSSGEAAVTAAAQRSSLNALFYDAYYRATQASPAHALFCERAYGRDLGQHGLADMAQIEALLGELELAPGMTLLDFGCGDGRITEYIADVTGACVSGVDIAGEAIALAQTRTQARREQMAFACADVEASRGALPSGPFDRIIAIDSLFFAHGQAAVTRLLLDRLAPRARMGVFYLCTGGPPPAGTALGQALTRFSIPYRVRDFSAANAAHWQAKRDALHALEPLFRAEGNDFLYENRLADCQSPGEQARYLYLASSAAAA